MAIDGGVARLLAWYRKNELEKALQHPLPCKACGGKYLYTCFECRGTGKQLGYEKLSPSQKKSMTDPKQQVREKCERFWNSWVSQNIGRQAMFGTWMELDSIHKDRIEKAVTKTLCEFGILSKKACLIGISGYFYWIEDGLLKSGLAKDLYDFLKKEEEVATLEEIDDLFIQEEINDCLSPTSKEGDEITRITRAQEPRWVSKEKPSSGSSRLWKIAFRSLLCWLPFSLLVVLSSGVSLVWLTFVPLLVVFDLAVVITSPFLTGTNEPQSLPQKKNYSGSLTSG